MEPIEKAITTIATIADRLESDEPIPVERAEDLAEEAQDRAAGAIRLDGITTHQSDRLVQQTNRAVAAVWGPLD